MTCYLKNSEWYSSVTVPEGMNLDMINMPDRLTTLLKPGLDLVVDGSIVMDMGAGTGVMGLYALSKGAKFVYFVEADPQMGYILENTLPNKIDPSRYKLIKKDLEYLTVADFDQGLPEVAVSEFYGPRLFDEGYIAYSKHVRTICPDCHFIPDTFKCDFYIVDIDYSQPIWPNDSTLIDQFKFMYAEKGFAKHITNYSKDNYIGTIDFSANMQKFNNLVEFKYSLHTEQLLLGVMTIEHGNLVQDYTCMGWYMNNSDFDKEFKIYFDADHHFNPRKIELNVK